jgi:hypothetical protein
LKVFVVGLKVSGQAWGAEKWRRKEKETERKTSAKGVGRWKKGLNWAAGALDLAI